MFKIVERPVFTHKNENIIVLKKDSHLLVNFAYETKEYEDTPIYKHIILSEDLFYQDMNRKEPVRLVVHDTLLCKLTHLYKALPQYKECLTKLFFEELIRMKCPLDTLISIRNYIKEIGCRGIIDEHENVLVFSERDITIPLDYKISYPFNKGSSQIIEDILNHR